MSSLFLLLSSFIIVAGTAVCFVIFVWKKHCRASLYRFQMLDVLGGVRVKAEDAYSKTGLTMLGKQRVIKSWAYWWVFSLNTVRLLLVMASIHVFKLMFTDVFNLMYFPVLTRKKLWPWMLWLQYYNKAIIENLKFIKKKNQNWKNNFNNECCKLHGFSSFSWWSV